MSTAVLDKEGQRIYLGHITGVSGLKGWVKVHSDTTPRENIVSYPGWWLEQADSWNKVNVLDGRAQGKTIVAKIEGVSNPEQASQFIGAKIAVDRGSMPQLSAGEYYWADLTGMMVQTIDGEHIGKVDRLFETGANDVVVVTDERGSSESEGSTAQPQTAVKRAKSSNEILVPWLVPDVVTKVDMDSRIITVDWDPDF